MDQSGRNNNKTDDEEEDFFKKQENDYDFDIFEKKDKQKDIKVTQESTQIQLNNDESNTIDYFDNSNKTPQIEKLELKNIPTEINESYAPNSTKRKSTFHPNKVKSINDRANQQEIELTNTKPCLLYTSPSPRDS